MHDLVPIAQLIAAKLIERWYEEQGDKVTGGV